MIIDLSYFNKLDHLNKIAAVLSSSLTTQNRVPVAKSTSMSQLNTVRKNQDQPMNTLKSKYVNTPSIESVDINSHMTNRSRAQQNSKLNTPTQAPRINTITPLQPAKSPASPVKFT